MHPNKRYSSLTTAKVINITPVKNSNISNNMSTAVKRSKSPRKISLNKENRSIRCFSIKNIEQDNKLEESAEKLLIDDLFNENSNKTTKQSLSDKLLIFNNELDDENISEIKTSLFNHYLLTDLSVTTM
jgi:hypothetical protein